MAERKYDDDDGRTIADMSDFERPSLFSLTPRAWKKRAQESRTDMPEQPISREERRMYVFAAMRAGLLIGLAFMVGLLIVVLLMELMWKIF